MTHVILMAVQRGMDQHIARCCAYAPNIPGFLKGAGQHNRGIRVQMAVARQAEARG
jgi:hypothetical protein